jgi:hypothetical protein
VRVFDECQGETFSDERCTQIAIDRAGREPAAINILAGGRVGDRLMSDPRDEPIACSSTALPRQAFVVEADLIDLGRVDTLKPNSLGPDRDCVGLDDSSEASQCSLRVRQRGKNHSYDHSYSRFDVREQPARQLPKD